MSKMTPELSERDLGLWIKNPSFITCKIFFFRLEFDIYIWTEAVVFVLFFLYLTLHIMTGRNLISFSYAHFYIIQTPQLQSTIKLMEYNLI